MRRRWQTPRVKKNGKRNSPLLQSPRPSPHRRYPGIDARTLRRELLRAGRGIQTRCRQLSLRLAAQTIDGARTRDRRKIIASATTVSEARVLEQRGCDAVIAQGFEAGGHRGNFIAENMAGQVGTFALVPQIADAVRVPVIASGGIADARGIVAAFVLGAHAVQIGTAYLLCPEAKITRFHLHALKTANADDTMLTNVFTGRPARGIANRIMRELGPLAPDAPAFPLAGGPLMPLRQKTEPADISDFSSMWSGQAARLATEMPAGDLTQHFAATALALFGKTSGKN